MEEEDEELVNGVHFRLELVHELVKVDNLVMDFAPEVVANGCIVLFRGGNFILVRKVATCNVECVAGLEIGNEAGLECGEKDCLVNGNAEFCIPCPVWHRFETCHGFEPVTGVDLDLLGVLEVCGDGCKELVGQPEANLAGG